MGAGDPPPAVGQDPRMSVALENLFISLADGWDPCGAKEGHLLGVEVPC